jgi:hypothetical protein
MLVTFTDVYEQHYGFSVGVTGLTYLGTLLLNPRLAAVLTLCRTRNWLFNWDDMLWFILRSSDEDDDG